MEDRGYTEVQKAWQAWTFVDFDQKNSGQNCRAGGGGMRRTAPAWGLAQLGREVFCPWRPLEVITPWQARTFIGRRACTQYTPKVIVGAKTLDPKGDAYYGS